MKKIIILSALMLLSTSFKNAEPELTWVATINIFADNEGLIVIHYKGNIPQCMAKKLVDILYEDCDTVKYSIEEVEQSLKIKLDGISDTCKDKTNPIKTIRT